MRTPRASSSRAESPDTGTARVTAINSAPEPHGLRFVDELSADSLKAGKEMEDKLKSAMREFLEKSGIPSREEFEALKKRVEAIEQEGKEEN
jgi:hypothetical protein